MRIIALVCLACVAKAEISVVVQRILASYTEECRPPSGMYWVLNGAEQCGEQQCLPPYTSCAIAVQSDLELSCEEIPANCEVFRLSTGPPSPVDKLRVAALASIRRENGEDAQQRRKRQGYMVPPTSPLETTAGAATSPEAVSPPAETIPTNEGNETTPESTGTVEPPTPSIELMPIIPEVANETASQPEATGGSATPPSVSVVELEPSMPAASNETTPSLGETPSPAASEDTSSAGSSAPETSPVGAEVTSLPPAPSPSTPAGAEPSGPPEKIPKNGYKSIKI